MTDRQTQVITVTPWQEFKKVLGMGAMRTRKCAGNEVLAMVYVFCWTEYINILCFMFYQ